jgi:hemolysin activation/secretion protein
MLMHATIAYAADPAQPSARPLPEPSIEESTELPSLLPPIPPSREPMAPLQGDADSGLIIRSWQFEGNSVFSDEELTRVVEPWTGRALTPAELQAARDALTLRYVRDGYFTSGALIPDQEVADGRVQVLLVEGSLVEIDIQGNEWFRDFYLRDRLELAGASPLHVPRLEEQIRRLLQDDRIARIDASLRPGDRLGEARLEVKIEEASFLHASVETSNHVAPSLGDVRGLFEVRHTNFSGIGDEIAILVGGYEAGPELEGRYRIPITRYDTSLGFTARWTDSELVDRLGQELDVEGEFWNFELDLRQPIHLTSELDLTVGLMAALRQSDTRVLGIEFNEVGPRTRVFVLRLYQELLWRGRSQVLAARSTVNFGIDALGATSSDFSSLPDSRFVSWLGQLQWLRRFDPWGVELLLRGDVQLSADPLLSIEQYSSGGHANVRGYRENQLVRDQGWFGSAELRVPLWRDSVDGRTVVQLAPFFDVGRAWNRDRPTLSPTTLYSAGLALRVQPWSWLSGELSWAERLADVERPEGLQGDGIQFRIVMDFF